MRIWDISVSRLCKAHLIAEHNELHIIWKTLITGRKAWANHPETKRWIGKLKALYNRHEEQVEEMINRGGNHKSLLDKNLISGLDYQDEFINTIDEQYVILLEKSKELKKCRCNETIGRLAELV